MGTFWSGERRATDQGEGGARFKAGEGRIRRGVRVASPWDGRTDGRKAGMFNDARGRVTRHVGPIERNQSAAAALAGKGIGGEARA